MHNLDGTALKQRCLRFVTDHAQAIAGARPEIPHELNDRAADIWEPLLALADLAGGSWPQAARQAAIGLSASGQESDPIGALLLDVFVLFAMHNADRLFSRTLVEGLDGFVDRPWMARRKRKQTTELWLAQQLRPYGVVPRSLRIDGARGKGYLEEDFKDVFRRYIPRAEVEALKAEWQGERDEAKG